MLQALHDALGVVEPVDAERPGFRRARRSRAAVLRASRSCPSRRPRLLAHGTVDRHADGIRAHGGGVAMAAARSCARGRCATSRTRSTVAESYCSGEECGSRSGRRRAGLEKLGLPGADSERLGIGPGNMPEDRHARIGPRRLDHARQQSEMVVLHKDDRVGASFHLFKQRIGKARFTCW